MNDVVQSLWIGSRLTAMERLSIASFLAAGHDYHLYVYDDVAAVPAGVVVKDGREVLPESMIFRYAEQPSYAGFSNYFRYKLLLESGGWWVDADVVCLRALASPEPYVFASEMDHGRQAVSSCAIKAPAGCPFLERAFDACMAKDRRKLRWGETGPRLLGDMVAHCQLHRFVRPAEEFCPLAYTDWRRQLNARAPRTFSASTYAVHLWNEMWRRSDLDKNGDYDPDCLYQQLRRKFPVVPPGRMRTDRPARCGSGVPVAEGQSTKP